MLNSGTTETAQPGPDREADSAQPFGSVELLRQFRTGVPVSELSRLADQTAVNTFVTVSVSVLATAFILLDSQQPAVIAWMLVQAGLSTIVSWRARSPRVGGLRTLDQARLTRAGLYRAVGWATFSGLLWGCLTVFIPNSSPEARIAIILTIGGMAAGGSTTLAAVPQVAIAYIVSCSLPLVVYFLSQATALGALVAIAAVIFSGAMIATTRIIHQSLRRQLDAEQLSEHFRSAVLQHRIDSVSNAERPVDDLLADSIREICIHTGWEAGFAYLPGSAGSGRKTSWTLRRRCTFGDASRLDTPDAQSASRRLLAMVSERAAPAWIECASDQPPNRPPSNLLSGGPARAPAGAEAAGIVVGMPVIARQKVSAIALFFTGGDDPPGPGGESLLGTIGVHLGNTFERHEVVRKLRATEQRARREEARAREYLDIAAAIVVAIDRNERIMLVNRACARTLGCAEGDAIGQNWYDHFVPPAEREHRRALFRQWMNGEANPPAQLEAHLLSRSGKLHLVRAQTTVLRDDDGTIYGLLTSAEDITEQRSTEAQLQQAQKMEAVGQLASGIAHDFNNVLMAARGNLELLQQTNELNDDGTALVSNSTAALDSAAALTSRLLSFSRKSILLTQPTRLDKVVRAIMEIVSRTFGRNITVQIDADADLWLADADPTQVES
ncbi:MAG: PAS domain S-box protein, partial [Pseudomonadota bacterium]